MAAPPDPSVTRRRLLIGLLLVPPAVSACALVSPGRDTPGDPLIGLADAARADAALAAAAIVADRSLADRVQPLVDARSEHALALDTEVQRLRAGRPSTSPSPPPVPTQPVTLARVREAARAASAAAAAVALDLPVDRVGLVASVSACCAGYAAVLT